MENIINYRTDPYWEVQVLDVGLFRGNVYYMGRMHWLPDEKILLVGDGERMVALKVGS